MDTAYNHPKYKALISDLTSHLNMVEFGDIIESISGGATPLRANEEQYADSGIKFLRIQNITPIGFDFSDVKYITETVHDNLLRRSQLSVNDLLMTITGRIGTSAVVTEHCLPANINQHIVRIRVKQGINPNFIAAYLNSPIGLLLSNRSVTGTTRLALDYESIKRIPIPSLSREKQNCLYNSSCASINNYLQKLRQATEEYQQAIERFERETALFDFSSFDNKLFFSVHLKDIKGKRFDVKNVYYCQSIATKEITNSTLGSLTVDEPCYGTSATAIERTSEEQPKYIRITDFDDFGIKENHKYMTAETYAEKHFLKRNDILFARSGSIGRTYFYDGSIGAAIFAGYCIRFRFDENKVIPKYVYWCTKTSSYQNWVKGIQRSAVQPNINKEEYKSFEIALPCLEEQKRFVEFMDKAFLSRQQTIKQAEQEWQSAKEQFEKELLQ